MTKGWVTTPTIQPVTLNLFQCQNDSEMIQPVTLNLFQCHSSNHPACHTDSEMILKQVQDDKEDDKEDDKGMTKGGQRDGSQHQQSSLSH